MEPKYNRLAPGPRWILALTSVVSFMVSLDSQVVATALPVVRLHLHASLAALEWTVNAYTLSFAVLLLTGAALGERLGRRRMLAAGVGLFTAASAACARAPNVGALIAARAVQGAGAALMLPPVRLFGERSFAAGNAAAFAVFAMLLALVFLMAQFLQTGLGYDPLGAGLRLLPGWVMLTLIAPFAGSLIARMGERPLITGGLTVAAGGLAWIALIARTGLPYSHLVAPLILAGSGASVAIPATMSAVMTSVPPAAIGRASGTLNMLRQLGGVFGIAICAAVFAARGGYASAAEFTSGFGPAMGACAGLALVGAAAALAIPGKRRAAPDEPQVPITSGVVETRR